VDWTGLGVVLRMAVLVLRFSRSHVDNIIWQITRPIATLLNTPWMREVCTETDERWMADGRRIDDHHNSLQNIRNYEYYYIFYFQATDEKLYLSSVLADPVHFVARKKRRLLKKWLLFNSLWVEISAVSALCRPGRQTDCVGSWTKGNSSTSVGNVGKFDLMQ